MYRKMVVGYAPERHGADALALAQVLASPGAVEEVLIVQVASHPEPIDAAWPEHVRVSTRATSEGSPAEALRSAADSEHADLLVLGSTHRGFGGRLLMGTTAGSIFPDARWPVVIAPDGYAESPAALHTIGVAYDGSAEAQAALRWGAALAAAFSAKMRLLAVVSPPPPPAEVWGPSVPADTWSSGLSTGQSIDAVDAMREHMLRELADARASIHQDDAQTAVIVGDPRYGLREAAEELDMLIVGSHGSGRVTGALMRSVSRGLAHSCPVPLVVVPGGGEAPEEPAA